MEDKKMLNYINDVLENLPIDWLNLTTHRLDIFDEKQAKSQFLDQFEFLFNTNNAELSALKELPTAYDYIRLGHPLSCVLEWVLADLNKVEAKNVISFSSTTMPILAILRKNLLENKNTQIIYTGNLPPFFDADVLRHVYGYKFDLKQFASNFESILSFEGTTIFLAPKVASSAIDFINPTLPGVDFFINTYSELGSVIFVNGSQNENYIPEIQHVRRRETIAMTPANCLATLRLLTTTSSNEAPLYDGAANKKLVVDSIANITGTPTEALLGSSGLSVQYAIMMGLIHDAQVNHPGKDIKFVVPPNCYGGTNDQARRVAAAIENVEIVDLPVDGYNNMVQSIDTILAKIAHDDAIPYIIAEIPTNPRVEVPDLLKLKAVLSAVRKTASGEIAIDPVFILDQTFCPNVHFLGEGAILFAIRTISYVSGSKFPSGGLCTAGYCVGNTKTEALLEKVARHLQLCDNEATNLQVENLAKQLPSMNQRIQEAYQNTREFVNFIKETLPSAKINFVSEELAANGFTPSVFSLDLPTKGATSEEQEAYKRALNLQLINLMITKIPQESKFCVSYGQLKGSYWTIPATSTQGTTKEGDKDYIVRVSLAPKMDLELHKKVFVEFVKSL
jgi:cystathionine beta-lyase/cystathionine gamma-synthase